MTRFKKIKRMTTFILIFLISQFKEDIVRNKYYWLINYICAFMIFNLKYLFLKLIFAWIQMIFDCLFD